MKRVYRKAIINESAMTESRLKDMFASAYSQESLLPAGDLDILNV